MDAYFIKNGKLYCDDGLPLDPFEITLSVGAFLNLLEREEEEELKKCKYKSKREKAIAESLMLDVICKYGHESQEAKSFCNLIETELKNGFCIEYNKRIGSRLLQLGF